MKNIPFFVKNRRSYKFKTLNTLIVKKNSIIGLLSAERINKVTTIGVIESKETIP